MRRLLVAAFAIAVGLAPLAHCGGTTGRDSGTTANGGDATVAMQGAADAGSDQSVYTNTFDVDIQYFDQVLPEAQTPSEAGGDDSGAELPNCPPFIYVNDNPDGSFTQIPFATCDPSQGCMVNSDEVPADWSDAGNEVPAKAGDVCATYPWLGTTSIDESVTSALLVLTATTAPNGLNPLPPCNWALEAGVATQGPESQVSRYKLCTDMYECFIRTQCFLYQNVSGSYNTNGVQQCLCENPTESANFNTAACLMDKGPCFDQVVAALEIPTNQDLVTYYKANTPAPSMANGVVGLEGAMLIQLFELSADYFPRCALDGGLGCDQ